MKRCPVCKTMVFDDMEICYGCMYHFGSDELLERKASELSDARREMASCDMREWLIRLEVRNGSDPDQTWSVELVPSCGPKPQGGAAAHVGVVPGQAEYRESHEPRATHVARATHAAPAADERVIVSAGAADGLSSEEVA